MLGHDHIPDELEVVPQADLVEDSYEAVASPRRAQQRTPPIATEGDEMEIAAPIETLQTIAHKQAANCNAKSKTAPLKGTRMRHPRLLSTNVRARMIHSANMFGTIKIAKGIYGPPAYETAHPRVHASLSRQVTAATGLAAHRHQVSRTKQVLEEAERKGGGLDLPYPSQKYGTSSPQRGFCKATIK